MSLPTKLYTCAQVRKLDAAAMQAGIPGIVLMKRAGKAAFDALLARWPEPAAIWVFCGAGNNGGDGYVVAALAAQKRLPVRVFSTVDTQVLTSDAKTAHDYAVREGVVVEDIASVPWSESASVVMVDGLLGTGFKGELLEEFREVTQHINQHGKAVLALDLPSGVDGDMGAADSDAINAQLTVSFVGLKQGLFTGKAPALTGELLFDDLSIPGSVYETEAPSCTRVRGLAPLPLRKADSHKKDFGHVLVIGGDIGTGGAAILAAEAAQRCGAGLVSLATRPEHVSAALSRLPEVMTVGVEAGIALEPMLERADVLVVGPGLGQSAWSKQLLYFAMQTSLPKVVDADALNLIAADRNLVSDTSRCVFTPHPGEAGRMLATSTGAIQSDRFQSVQDLVSHYGGTVLLKGAGTLVADQGNVRLLDVGHPAMAVAGMGDVLSGVIAAYLSQAQTPYEAAINGGCAHGLAGEHAAQEGEWGVRASDLLPHLRALVNQGFIQ